MEHFEEECYTPHPVLSPPADPAANDDDFGKFFEVQQNPKALCSTYTLKPDLPLTFRECFEDPLSDLPEVGNPTALAQDNSAMSLNGENHAITSSSKKHDHLSNGNNSSRTRKHRKRPKEKFSQKSSKFRGVSRYSGRFEAFIWDSTDKDQKAKTVYLGGFEQEEAAARAYDLAALKLCGTSVPLNFSLSDYTKDLEEMETMTKKEYLLGIRRKSKGFAKGASNYRGVSRKKADTSKKWQARLGKGRDLKGIYLGTFETEEEAARAYDVASIRLKGGRCITNFETNEYDVKSIFDSYVLPIGKGVSRTIKKSKVEDLIEKNRSSSSSSSNEELPQSPNSTPEEKQRPELQTTPNTFPDGMEEMETGESFLGLLGIQNQNSWFHQYVSAANHPHQPNPTNFQFQGLQNPNFVHMTSDVPNTPLQEGFTHFQVHGFQNPNFVPMTSDVPNTPLEEGFTQFQVHDLQNPNFVQMTSDVLNKPLEEGFTQFQVHGLQNSNFVQMTSDVPNTPLEEGFTHFQAHGLQSPNFVPMTYDIPNTPLEEGFTHFQAHDLQSPNFVQMTYDIPNTPLDEGFTHFQAHDLQNPNFVQMTSDIPNTTLEEGWAGLDGFL